MGDTYHRTVQLPHFTLRKEDLPKLFSVMRGKQAGHKTVFEPVLKDRKPYTIEDEGEELAFMDTLPSKINKFEVSVYAPTYDLEINCTFGQWCWIGHKNRGTKEQRLIGERVLEDTLKFLMSKRNHNRLSVRVSSLLFWLFAMIPPLTLMLPAFGFFSPFAGNRILGLVVSIGFSGMIATLPTILFFEVADRLLPAYQVLLRESQGWKVAKLIVAVALGLLGFVVDILFLLQLSGFGR